MTNTQFEAYPLTFLDRNPVTVEKAHKLLTELIRHESAFTDFRRGCQTVCGECDDCKIAKGLAAKQVMLPNSLVWEVWSFYEGALIDLMGILQLTDIVKSSNAKARWYFFDGKLRNKTNLLKFWIDWIFSEHDDWKPLHRLTLEIPAHAHAYVSFAEGLDFALEGVQREAVQWRGKLDDLKLYGRINAVQPDSITSPS